MLEAGGGDMGWGLSFIINDRQGTSNAINMEVHTSVVVLIRRRKNKISIYFPINLSNRLYVPRGLGGERNSPVWPFIQASWTDCGDILAVQKGSKIN